MRVFFAGTPDIAVPSLLKLQRDHEIVGVLTNPDRECGRGRDIRCCPVKISAGKLGLKVFQPEQLDQGFIDTVMALEPEILAVTAYGKIFRKNFIDIFPEGGLNVHPSLLPKYRGASPIQSALLSGDASTGITIQRLALKMDSGAILAQEEYVYDGTETAGSLTEYFAERGAELLSQVLTEIEKGTAEEREQDEREATYCSYIRKEEGLVDWSMSAEIIERRLRAFTPWPGIYTSFNGKKLNIIEAGVYEDGAHAGNTRPGEVVGIDKRAGILIQTGKGILVVRKLQLQSKKALEWRAFLNGVNGFNNAVLGGE